MDLTTALIVAVMVLLPVAGFAYGFGKGRAKIAARDEQNRRERLSTSLDTNGGAADPVQGG
jgi:hypothetical protein